MKKYLLLIMLPLMAMLTFNNNFVNAQGGIGTSGS